MDLSLIHPENLTWGSTEWCAFSPYLAVLLGACAVLILGVFPSAGKAWVLRTLTVGSLVVAGMASFLSLGHEPISLFNKMLQVDSFSSVLNLLITASTVMSVLMSFTYLEQEGLDHFEFYVLVLFASLGMMLLGASVDLLVAFIALELMSIAVYVLVGFRRRDLKSNEAALKYYILGSAASAVFLYGVALLYGATGSTHLLDILGALSEGSAGNPLCWVGIIFLTMGVLFKVAAVPFHVWMPDVYQGAPVVVTGFMTTGLKAAAFALALRVFSAVGLLDENSYLREVIWWSSVATMILGNLVALTQRNFKRMLAYSSIAHTGYMLLGMLGGISQGFGLYPVFAYLISYCFMNIGAFAVLAAFSGRQDAEVDIFDLAGLGWKRPYLGAAMALFLFSMAGVPPTVGFLGKYLLFSAALQSGEVALVVVGAISSAVSAYYYLRIIVMMYMKEPTRDLSQSVSLGQTFVVVTAAAATLAFGLFPSFMIEAAKRAVSSL